MSKRLMVLGLDGAELSLITHWIEKGKLPTFKKLIDGGTFGLLKTTIPFITPTAWTSAFTGVNP
jgi:predicted AlkP superfamily phosphohydrolase/phosphomutase